MNFHPSGTRKVVGGFDGGRITSDGGAFLLRELEAKTGIVAGFAQCFDDFRDPNLTEHSLFELLAQRIFGLVMGYEDLNDHDALRTDPALALAAGKDDPEGGGRRREADKGAPLAGKSTLNRLELGPAGGVPADARYKKIAVDPGRAADWFVETFLRSRGGPPPLVVLDADATDDPLHGEQEGRFFHGYYKEYCYLPLYIFCGRDLLSAKLRPGDCDASAGTKEELERIVAQIRACWPGVRVLLRGDAGFCREEIMAWCEANGVDYILGLPKNARLLERIAAEAAEAAAAFARTGEPSRAFASFFCRTLGSWGRERRVVAKAEHLGGGANPRFVVTSLEGDARGLYEDVYCARGDMENRVKEQKQMFSDRTSTHWMGSNQVRLWLSAAAYTVAQALRREGLRGTAMESAECATVRARLLKVGAVVKVSVRRVRAWFSESWPFAGLFRRALENLRAMRPWPGAQPMLC